MPSSEALPAVRLQSAFREVVRSRLTRRCPDEPARQAGRLNEAYAPAALLLDCVARAEAWLARRGP
jgi:hypothetical protein